MKWEIAKLGDISKNIQTGPFGSQLHQSDYSECGIPVVMPKDLVGGKISEESIARVDKTHVERLCRHKIEVGDILYSRKYSLQGTTQGNGLTGGVPPVRFSM